MTGGTYIINMKSLINPCCYHIERTSIVLQVFKSHASGVLMIGFVVVEYIIALRNLKSIFVAAVAGVGTHNGHQKEKYNGDGHKCPKPWVVTIVTATDYLSLYLRLILSSSKGALKKSRLLSCDPVMSSH